MKIDAPDIVVISPDGDYLMVVEVKINNSDTQAAIEQLRSYMASTGCSVGLLISGDRAILLRDSLEELEGRSIRVVGEAKLPDSLLPAADEQWRGKTGLEFESRVQRWLEQIKLSAGVSHLSDELRKLLGEPIISLLRLGEVRAANPRWSKAT